MFFSNNGVGKDAENFNLNLSKWTKQKTSLLKDAKHTHPVRV